MIRTGDRVRVTGLRGTVHGTVEVAHPPSQLPELPAPSPPAAVAREILDEWGTDLVALISYPPDIHNPTHLLLFAAMHVTHPEPGWRDLQGQVLEIEAVQ